MDDPAVADEKASLRDCDDIGRKRVTANATFAALPRNRFQRVDLAAAKSRLVAS
jgi:hypothetical protein